MAEPDIEQWRAEARGWLASVLPKRSDRSDTAPDYAVFANISEEAEHAMLDRVRAYRRQRFDAGYGAIALPAELGGAGLSPRYVVMFTAEEQGFEAPTSTELISVTTGLVGPTIATFGTDVQREKYGRAFMRSDLLCCQLFSEPGAGSDLAAVATTAVREDNGWRLDGQKVWSSGARFADYGLLLAPTDPDVAGWVVAEYDGLGIPMDSAGVRIGVAPGFACDQCRSRADFMPPDGERSTRRPGFRERRAGRRRGGRWH
jgi:alkylation response protein AidB-like acyl-CoA dehydrogenase